MKLEDLPIAEKAAIRIDVATLFPEMCEEFSRKKHYRKARKTQPN